MEYHKHMTHYKYTCNTQSLAHFRYTDGILYRWIPSNAHHLVSAGVIIIHTFTDENFLKLMKILNT